MRTWIGWDKEVVVCSEYSHLLLLPSKPFFRLLVSDYGVGFLVLNFSICCSLHSLLLCFLWHYNCIQYTISNIFVLYCELVSCYIGAFILRSLMEEDQKLKSMGGERVILRVTYLRFDLCLTK